jgi:membrane protein YqaA with SNARE-associated domain
LKALLARILAKMNLVFLPFLAKFGIWGIGALALLDSSTIPVPMDAFLAISIWNDRGRFLLYCVAAAAGSAIGGLLPYGLGRAGGELFLLKRIDRAKYEQMRNRFEKQEFLALVVPSMMPPPTPWKLFVFAAGVFEMRIPAFMLAVFVGRIIRFTVVSLLTIRYGPEIVHEVGRLMHDHIVAVLVTLGVVLGALALVALRKGMARRQTAS